ncbi:MAG: hypothetical protein R3321_13070, partial [Nitrososphaeraceae archaeon]|nr:hypothetical protein [Nitrososphaeraceae archaeon]
MIKKFIKKYFSTRLILFLNVTRNYIKSIFKRSIDIFLFPFTICFAIIFRHFRKTDFKFYPLAKSIFLRVGMFPLIDHYYEPLFNPKHLRYSLRKERYLPGIDFNDKEQLEVLKRFNFNEELLQFPIDKNNEDLEYCYDYGEFNSGDGEYLYNMIRLYKPNVMIEIGSGNSTLMARNAINKNLSDSDNNYCEHICIEPYEQPWLEKIGIKVIREKVENVGIEIFKQLKENDILFIDSSHMIRPQGDVLFE